MPPQFRVYPFDADMKPLPPKDVTLQIELHRLGGRIDRIDFRPEADYLRGEGDVEEDLDEEEDLAQGFTVTPSGVVVIAKAESIEPVVMADNI